MPLAVDDAPSAPSRPRVWRVTDRRSFTALRRQGQRGRRGVISVRFLPPHGHQAEHPPRVAFAVGKAVGGAVVRNRVRRRLRAALRELAGAHRLPSGTYLVGATDAAATLAWGELVAQVSAAVDEATR
jgi:ribonuclease P protein component